MPQARTEADALDHGRRDYSGDNEEQRENAFDQQPRAEAGAGRGDGDTIGWQEQGRPLQPHPGERWLVEPVCVRGRQLRVVSGVENHHNAHEGEDDLDLQQA